MTRPTSAIGRPLDPTSPTNRWIAVVTVAAGVLGTLVALMDGSGIPAALWSGVVAGLVLFAAWAVSRELDPDAERAAFLPVALAGAWLLVLPVPSLVLAFALLLTLRVVNRTVGPEASPIDAAAVLVMVAWAAFATGAWPLGILAAVAFALDRTLDPPGPTRNLVLAALALVIAVTAAVTDGPSVGIAPTGALFWTAVGATAVFAVRLARLETPLSRCDLTHEPLRRSRVRAAMALGLALALVALGTGRPSLTDAGVLWSCLAGLGTAGVARRSRP